MLLDNTLYNKNKVLSFAYLKAVHSYLTKNR